MRSAVPLARGAPRGGKGWGGRAVGVWGVTCWIQRWGRGGLGKRQTRVGPRVGMTGDDAGLAFSGTESCVAVGLHCGWYFTLTGVFFSVLGASPLHRRRHRARAHPTRPTRAMGGAPTPAAPLPTGGAPPPGPQGARHAGCRGVPSVVCPCTFTTAHQSDLTTRCGTGACEGCPPVGFRRAPLEGPRRVLRLCPRRGRPVQRRRTWRGSPACPDRRQPASGPPLRTPRWGWWGWRPPLARPHSNVLGSPRGAGDRPRPRPLLRHEQCESRAWCILLLRLPTRFLIAAAPHSSRVHRQATVGGNRRKWCRPRPRGPRLLGGGTGALRQEASAGAAAVARSVGEGRGPPGNVIIPRVAVFAAKKKPPGPSPCRWPSLRYLHQIRVACTTRVMPCLWLLLLSSPCRFHCPAGPPRRGMSLLQGVHHCLLHGSSHSLVASFRWKKGLCVDKCERRCSPRPAALVPRAVDSHNPPLGCRQTWPRWSWRFL